MTPTAAGICFIAPDGRVLLMKRAEKPHVGTWAYPGGKIEAGETPEQAARREVREECGYDYTGPLLPLGVNQQGFQGVAARVAPFAPELNEEHSAAVWAPFDKLPSPVIPGMVLQTTAHHAADELIKGKSDAVRSENIATEVKAGKDPKQAAAIAYSVQRQAQDTADPLASLHQLADRLCQSCE